MATKTWTPQQQKVIDLRDRNILVSAAAGSGKTAVLVERIIQRITSEVDPISIDELLIVTFTKAAAGEMRERIGTAIEEKVKQNPDNVHLQKQMTLLYNAQITTIDSFCLYVIRNYFHTIDLDPSFRIADEAELTLLKSDVIAKLLEDYYEEGQTDFLEFIDMYAATKSDLPIEDLILKLYQFSMSYPYPQDWLAQRSKDFNVTCLEELSQTEWMKATLKEISLLLQEAKLLNNTAINACNRQGGPKSYLQALLSDQEYLDSFNGIKTYEDYYTAISQCSFARLSTKKDLDSTEEQKNLVKAVREQYKDIIKDLASQFFFQKPEEMLTDILKVKRPMQILIQLTNEFITRLASVKEENNLVDFSDLEHFALQILRKKDGETFEPTNAAIELSNQFEEIMIDEYQDSNYVQEYILTSISREKNGKNNIFMVGDVKQSIYKFRLARPELFMEKYNKYTSDASPNQKIDLSKNFRSRAEVLESINRIFEKTMIPTLGGIEYNEGAALYPGAKFSEANFPNQYQTELIVMQSETSDEEETDRQLEELTNRELEARAIAKRIHELLDEEEGKYQYKDVVILLRTMSNWSEIFVETLLQERIPAYSDTQSGYFQTLEVKTMLNYLRILDNPQQDLAVTAVLYSPFGNLSSNELSMLRTEVNTVVNEKRPNMYEAARQFIKGDSYETEEKQILKDKLIVFFQHYDSLYEMKTYLTVRELIEKIYEVTGYDKYVLAMPGGAKRYDNLMMLITHANEFEQSSYHGLFQFIRYIEKLLKYEIDYGEAVALGENDNAVRIMSIHKSKGLEFPVVFVGGMGKQFNQMDARDKIVLHADYGIGPDCIDLTLRTKNPTLIKKVIQNRVVLDNLAEELRVLYVAFTRAKEKLIMVGTVKDAQKEQDKWRDAVIGSRKQLMFQTLCSARSYLSFVGPCTINEPTIHVRVMTVNDLTVQEYKNQTAQQNKQLELRKENFEKIKDAQLHEEFMKRVKFSYPYAKEASLPIKTTVSELKKLGQNADEELSSLLKDVSKETTALVEFEPTIPKFLKKEVQVSSSDRGTLVHKIMECMDFVKVRTTDDIRQLIQELIDKNIIGEDAFSMISLTAIADFVTSDLCSRLRVAQQQQTVKREQQFVLGIPANQIEADYSTDDIVLIQGIIDLYFEEDGDIVLVDYKTDRIMRGQEQSLVARYHKQLEYYERAITQLTGKKVKEKLIYSFALSKVIPVGV